AADRYGPRLPTFAGALLLGAGLTPLAISAGQLPLELLAATLAFAGVGLALTFPSMRLAAVEVVPERYAALASGVFSTSRYFGGMPNSRATTAACDSGPPTSVTTAAALVNSGIHDTFDDWHTRTSPRRNFAKSSRLRTRRAGPRATPADAGAPRSARAGSSCTSR